MPPEVAFHDSDLGRMRSRAVGEPRAGVPEVVVVQGMAVADYLMPGIGALRAWTRAHLVELPGFAGSGDPPHEPDVAEFGQCVAGWLAARGLGRVVLAGHSSGTPVAARAASAGPDVAGVVLASPTVDPVARNLLKLFVRWRLDGRHEPPGLKESHLPEWRRAGPRRLVHLVWTHLHDRLEDSVSRLEVPLLVIRGRQDVIGTEGWARELAALLPDGEYVEVDGAHTFPWQDPDAWSEPIRRFAARLTPETSAV
jgi:pimeloyl-ACP methyl ester carboxylesterase